MAGSNYGTIWLDIETNTSPGCSWSSFSHESNCEFVNELVEVVKSRGKPVGIYASYYMWENIFGSPSNCPGHGALPLWYPHYDKDPSFSDFKPFGGWTKPTIKQYENTHYVCGAGVDTNWYP